MTYHDHTLISADTVCQKPIPSTNVNVRVWKLMLKGARQITFKPSSPRICFGTVGDDWQAVGADIHFAIRNHRDTGE